MNKDTAIRTMYDGHKVAHRWFSPGEWMKLAKEHPNYYEFEDGCICPMEEFWAIRDDHTWQDGWKRYTQSTDNNALSADTPDENNKSRICLTL